MHAFSDTQLLREYAERRSDAAFAELVRRHLDLVHSAACRILSDPHLAKDASQCVFMALAKEAPRLLDHPTLTGWLHRTTFHISSHMVRGEVRRRTREQEAAAMNETPDASWEEIAPHLDAAIAELNAKDREAVLLRFFEGKPAPEMATLLGIGTEAAQKRANRAVERLRAVLARRGITAAGLAGIVSSNAVQTAPAGLAAVIARTALTAAGGTSIASSTAWLGTTPFQKALAGTAIALLVGGGIYLASQAARPESASMAEVSGVTAPAKYRTRENPSQAAEDSLNLVARAKAERQKKLVDLKQRWLDFHRSLEVPGILGSNEANVRHRELCAESYEALLCGSELVELIDFLKKEQIYNSLDLSITKLFDSPRAAEARGMLVGLPDTGTWVSLTARLASESEPFRERWSKQAGRTCPDEEFDAFVAALDDPNCAQEAQIGRDLGRATSDPAVAFASLLQVLAKEIPSESRNSCLYHFFDLELPEDTNFAELEAMLPEDEAPEEGEIQQGPISTGRKELYREWASRDPEAAMGHLLGDPERATTGLVSQAVTACLELRREEVFLFLESLAGGPYGDQVLNVAANHMSGEDEPEAMRLAGKIQDEELRTRCLQQVRKRADLIRKLNSGEIREGG